MVSTGAVANNIFRVVEHIIIEYIQNKAHEYFGLQKIGSLNQVVPNPLTVLSLTQLAYGNAI